MKSVGFSCHLCICTVFYCVFNVLWIKMFFTSIMQLSVGNGLEVGIVCIFLLICMTLMSFFQLMWILYSDLKTRTRHRSCWCIQLEKCFNPKVVFLRIKSVVWTFKYILWFVLSILDQTPHQNSQKIGKKKPLQFFPSRESGTMINGNLLRLQVYSLATECNMKSFH